MGKYRRQHQLFVAEGTTNVLDFIRSGLRSEAVYATHEWLTMYKSHLGEVAATEVSMKELRKISSLKNPSEVLAIFEKPADVTFDIKNINDLILMLDDIHDPGNLGTIIRTADWFGIQNIICSEETVDAFNPKVVQASMGSLARVQLYYHDLEEAIQSKPDYMKVFGAVLNGDNIAEVAKPNHGIILVGSEAHGISQKLLPLIDVKITIPKHISNDQITSAESLNASIATAIMFQEFKR